jgi:hypothetical protein
MVQLPPAATVVQALVSANGVEAVILDTFRLAVPVFVNVTVCAALIVLTFSLANVRLVADKLTAGVGVTGVDTEALLPPHAAATSASPKATKAGTLPHLRRSLRKLNSKAASRKTSAILNPAPVFQV